MKIEMVMGDALRRNAYKYPLKIALRDSQRQITYGELNQRVNRLANGLLSKGIRKGDPVALLVGNRVEHIEILIALAKIGALGIPLDIKWRALEIASTLSSLEAVAVFLEDTCQEEYNRAKEQKSLEAIQPYILGSKSYHELVNDPSSDEPTVETEEDFPFLVMITSGTTSFPKGCLVSHDPMLSTVSTTPSRKDWGFTILPFSPPPSISATVDHLPWGRCILAAR